MAVPSISLFPKDRTELDMIGTEIAQHIIHIVHGDCTILIQGPQLNRALVNRSNWIMVQHYPLPEWALL